jgi:hypothetical protein
MAGVEYKSYLDSKPLPQKAKTWVGKSEILMETSAFDEHELGWNK